MIQTYIVLILSSIIFISVIVIASKAIRQGIAAKRNNNKKVKDSDLLDDEENHNKKFENLSLTNELEKINKLYRDGLLSEEEFTKAKNKILD